MLYQVIRHAHSNKTYFTKKGFRIVINNAKAVY